MWSIRVRLEMSGNKRNLALFNMAVDSKLRGCDLVCLRVRDVFAAGHVKERAAIIQSKTGKPVRFEISESTRHSWSAGSPLPRWSVSNIFGRVGFTTVRISRRGDMRASFGAG